MRLVKSLLRTPSFTVASVGALALGIGASAALFSVVDGILLHPLSYPSSARLVVVDALRGSAQQALSYPQFQDWSGSADGFEAMAFASGDVLRVRSTEMTTQLRVAMVTPEFFRVLRTRPLLGRTPSEGGGGREIIVSERAWRSQFASDPSIIGRTIDTQFGSFTIVGVMPSGFEFPNWAESWTPLAPLLASHAVIAKRDWRADGRAIALVSRELTIARAQARLAQAVQRFALAYPTTDEGLIPKLTPLELEVVGDTKVPLGMLTASVSILLLVAYANVATLLLVRLSARAREFVVRRALGARSSHIVRLILEEGLALSAAGSALGLGLAAMGIRVLKLGAIAQLPRLSEVTVGTRTVVVVALLAVIGPLLFAALPGLMMHAGATDLSQNLRQGVRGAGRGRREVHVRSALLVSQIALAIVLLVAGGLLVRSFVNLRAVPPGFDPDRLLSLRVNTSPQRYPTAAQLLVLDAQLVREIEGIPGVASAAVTSDLAFLGTGAPTSVFLPERGLEPSTAVRAMYRSVDDGYFATIGQGIRRGRAFRATDMTAGARAVIVNERLAAALWPGVDPIGRYLIVPNQSPGQPEYGQPLRLEVIGVARDVKFRSLADPSVSELYVPLTISTPARFHLVVRARSALGAILPTVRRAIRSIDPDIATNALRPVSDFVADSMASRRMNLVLVLAFMTGTIMLAAIGLFGIIAYLVSQRQHEIGVRSALGELPYRLVWSFVRQGIRLAILGLTIGVPLAIVATRLVRAMLFGIGPFDPLTFGAAAALLLIVSLIATYLPARRAAKVSPLEALREA